MDLRAEISYGGLLLGVVRGMISSKAINYSEIKEGRELRKSTESKI